MTIPDFADAIRPEDPDGEPISVVPFPSLHPEALQGLAGKIVEAMASHTEAHPAAILAQLLSRFGATVGDGPHMLAGNKKHPARINSLIVGSTSDGAKGTSHEVVAAVFGEVDKMLAPSKVVSLPRSKAQRAVPELRVLSGLSSGEGLIELVRDANGLDADKAGFDEGVIDKRLLIVEPEFCGTLTVATRTGSILPRVLRECWDGGTLQTLTRNNPLKSTGAHIAIVGHACPGELRAKLKDEHISGGTMNRFLVTASRRMGMHPDGGNIPSAILAEYGAHIAATIEATHESKQVRRTGAADRLWNERYPTLCKARPDGPVASCLARAVPQVLRLSLTYALLDSSGVIDAEHLSAALALWRYVEDSTEWLFGAKVDTAEVDALLRYIAVAGKTGRTREQIRSEHYQRNRDAAEINVTLGNLIKDGRVRQETDRRGRGRPSTRYYA